MLKQSRTLMVIASLSFLMTSLGTEDASAFKIISFDGQAARWNNSQAISIEYDPNFGSDFNSSGCDQYGPCVTPAQIVQSSINTWKNVSNVDLSVNTAVAKTISSTPKYDGKNQIKFYSTGWESLPFAPPSSALAVTISTYDEAGKILDADIFFNGANFNWGVVNSDMEGGKYDVQNVLTHELGHFFGLNHTSENSSEPDVNRFEATMFYASLAGETFRRSLESMDVQGIQHLYTDETVPSPLVDELSPNKLQVDFKGSATFEITGDNFLPTTSVVFARKNGDGDFVGRVNAIDNNKISVSFDLSNMQSGEYDLVVANSYNKSTRMVKAFNIQNSTVLGTYSNDSASTSGNGGCHSNGSSSILFFLLPILFLITKRTRKIA